MKLKLLNGKLKDFSVTRSRIDWLGDSLSNFQAECKDLLYPYWKHNVVCEEFRIFGRMSLDFFNVSKKIVVEIQGAQHSRYIPFMAGSRSGYLSQIKRDLKKTEFCEINDLKFIEIHPEDMEEFRKDPKKWTLEHYNIDL